MSEPTLPFVFIGHTNALREVQEAFASGRMPHAWLIAGIEGIGKAALAKHIAQYVLANGEGVLGKPDAKHPAAKLVEAESHPDLLIVRRPQDERTGAMKNIIPVDDILKIAPFLHKTATHGGWRVVIVDEAHALNRNGQNAILKIVEEPPPRTLILLTVTTPGALLPTIRSRARILELSPLSAEDMQTLLRDTAPQASAEDMATVIDLSGGSLGFALKMLRAGVLPLYKDMLGILDALPGLDMARLHKLADQIARKADSDAFDALKALLIERLRKAAETEAKNQSPANVGLALKIWDKTRATFAAAETANLDRKLAFINAVSDIRAAMAASA
ncbi:MAG: DNA polymerase III subunit delta' [Alphaproteobacteria bacterium]|nr:DNA polymerase III subunit delta' [Alphaproteobacteria bacterium]